VTDSLTPGLAVLRAAVVTVKDDTVEVMAVADELAGWARVHATGAWQIASNVGAGLDATGGLLDGMLRKTRDAGAPLRFAARWLMAVACAPTVDDCNALIEMLESRSRAARAVRRDWLDLDGVGYLAWAAGVSPAEVIAERDAGGLDVERLTTLASLRGWLFPLIP
jgi:hypothetical protein